MQKRKLGNSNLEISTPDCMGMSRAFEPIPDRQKMILLIRTAVEHGVTFFDTAEMYDGFANEKLVKEALEPFRGQVVIATKFGHNLDPITGVNLGGENNRPEHIKQTIEGSLKPYYQHRIAPNVPIEEVAGVVKDLIQAGKVRHFGLSEASAWTIAT